jgi:hypothetical protein
MLQIFIALKNPSPLAMFEPVNLALNGKHDNHLTTENDLPYPQLVFWCPVKFLSR